MILVFILCFMFVILVASNLVLHAGYIELCRLYGVSGLNALYHMDGFEFLMWICVISLDIACIFSIWVYYDAIVNFIKVLHS